GLALRAGDAPRLRVAAHKLCGLLSAFSTMAGAAASDLEDQAAGERLDECRRLVGQLEAMARELLEQVDGLSIEALRGQAGAAGGRDRTASPLDSSLASVTLTLRKRADHGNPVRSVVFGGRAPDERLLPGGRFEENRGASRTNLWTFS